jgi:hypothetical protein
MLRKLFRRTIVGDEKAPKELEACLGRPGKESRPQSIQTLKFSSAIAPNGAPGILGHLFQKIPVAGPGEILLPASTPVGETTLLEPILQYYVNDNFHFPRGS